jgi:hypothetical protein
MFTFYILIYNNIIYIIYIFIFIFFIFFICNVYS